MDKEVTIRFENKEYVWHNKNWYMPRNNLTVSTSLSQRLTEMALKSNLLTHEDLVEKKTK